MPLTFTRCFGIVALAAPLLTVTPLSAADDTLARSIDLYQQRYQISVGGVPDKSNPYEKIVQNHGEGPETLQGLRNLRAVLPGVVYRSGGNNRYRDRYGKKRLENENPLPPEGLANLCREGFSTATYLYETNYETAASSNACQIRSDIASTQPPNTLAYLDKLPTDTPSGKAAIREILQMVHAKLTGVADARPMLVHCWNGWHASGITSTLILRQFCGVGADEAVAYWNCNTDGVCIGNSYNKIRKRIRAFNAYNDLKISDEIKAKVCPKLANACPYPPKKACPI
jgi:hypothetical protein